MSFINNFKKFAMRGNLIDLAIGFTVGAAFSTIAKSLVNDLIMPVVGLVLGESDFSDLYWLLRPGSEAAPPYATLADAQSAGAVTLNYGMFINSVMSFLVVALAMYFIIRAVNKVNDELEEHFGDPPPNKEDPVHKKCNYCRETIAYTATRCPHCTSQLEKPVKKPAP